MQFRLRTLLIVLALGPVILAGAWSGYEAYLREQEQKRIAQEQVWIDLPFGRGKLLIYPQDVKRWRVPVEVADQNADSQTPSPLP